MPIAMEESIIINAAKVTKVVAFFAVTKERRALMYAKLDKLREDLKKGSSQKEAADAKVKAAGSKAERRGKPADRQ